MAGTISSLGLASGTLTGDVIDKLKAADKAKQVTPYEKKIKNNETRTSDLNTLKKMANELKSLADNLSSETNYLDVNAKTTGDFASVTAQAGARVQSFDLNVGQLAQKQIDQSKGFASETGALEMEGSLKFKIGEKTYEVEVKKTMNLKDVKDAIFDATEGKIIASSLKTGGADPFSLVLKSTETGKANEFEVLNEGLASEFGFTNKQKAQDAMFDYDGVRVTRSSNKIDDLISGVSIQLKNAGKIDADGKITDGKTTVNIEQKTSNIVENTEKFVEKYNELMRNLNTVTSFDAEKKVRGTFQGNNEINSIKQQIRNSLLVTNGSMESFGFTLERSGEIKFDKSKLEHQIKTDFSKVKDFFQGTTENPGMFAKAKNTLYDLTTSNNGLFKLVEDDLKTNTKNLAAELKSAQKNLDSKYEIMTRQFAAYDAMISKMNASFASMKMMIQQSMKSS